ncbi:MAG: response regulator [Planctomycetota bacterium]
MNNQERQCKVTFVDDDPFLLDSIRRQLDDRELNCQIAFFDSGVDAWEDAQSTTPDLLFTDIQMPKMRGDELLKLFRQNFPSTIRVVLSSTNEDTLGEYGELIHRILEKPVSSAEIAKLIEETLGNASDPIS